MNQLSSGARALIDRVGVADGPSGRDRERVRKSLFGAIAASATVAGSAGTALGAHAGSGLGTAAAAEVAGSGGLAALTGKGSAAIALWFVAGGAAGTAIATPVALYSEDRPEAAVVAPTHGPAANAEPAVERRAASATNAKTSEPSQPAFAGVPRETAGNRGSATGESQASSIEPPKNSRGVSRAPDPAREKPAEAPQIASELALLKSAQRELASANASQSLALLDDHARRYPEGALKAERLGARVFALCQLGQVEQARAAAREFLSVAGSSPLVPRVLASCAGSGTTEPRASNPASGTKR